MRIGRFLPVLALAAVIASCDDDVTNPRLGALARLWPDDEGRSWSYAGTWTNWDSDFQDSAYVFADSSDVPDSPGWDTILPYLDAVPTGPSYDGGSYTLGLRFEGTLNVTPAHSVRNLQPAFDGTDFAFCAGDTTPALARYRTLGALSPDLLYRVRLLHSGSLFYPPNVLIHGGAFERTQDWIGTYGCLDSLLAWKFLISDLRPGSTFTHQLVPSLLDHLFLRGYIRRNTTIDTQAGRFDALEVDYAVDYGIVGWTDAGSPEPYGYGRLLFLGKVFYVTDVGPVASFEWDTVPVGKNGQLGIGIGEVRLDLTSTSAPPSPSQPSLPATALSR
jgi:hypothetical protein